MGILLPFGRIGRIGRIFPTHTERVKKRELKGELKGERAKGRES